MKNKDRLKVLHIISGGDTGGAKTSVITLLSSLKQIVDVQLVCFVHAEFSREAIGAGIPTIVMPQKNRLDFTVLNQLVKHINKEKYDLINCHGARANFLANLIRHRITIKMVTTIHSDYIHDFDNSLYKKLVFTMLNKISLQHFEGYIVVAKQFKKEMVKRGFDPNKIFVGYNGLEPLKIEHNTDKQAYLKSYGIPYNPQYFYYGLAVRLHPIKGIDVLLKAAKRLKKQAPHIKVLIAGDGEEKYKNEYLQFIKENKLEDTVYLMGFVSDIYDFYGTIDVNGLTSHSEGISYSLLEGGRFRKPTVATAVGGTPEVIEDEVTGLLVADGDDKMLAEKLIRLYEDKWLRERLAENLYKKVDCIFSAEGMAEGYKDIYKNIINRVKGGKKILVSGYYGYSNSGDDAILEAICHDIKTVSPLSQLTILSYKPESTKKEYNVNAVNKFNPITIVKAIYSCDVLLMGGGTLLQDESSSRSLYYYLFLLWFAKFLGKRSILYANGIGPVNRPFNRKLSKYIGNKVDIITLREKMSRQELKNMGITKPEVHVTADPVFTYPKDLKVEVDYILRNVGIQKSEGYVAVLFRGWKGQGHYVKHVARLCDFLVKEHGVKILLIPMKYPADLKICQEIERHMTTTGIVMNKKYDVKTQIELIGQAKFVLSMRLHALLYAALKGIPMVGFSYSEKIKYYMEELDVPYVDNVADFTYEEAKGYVEETLLHHEGYKKTLEEKVTAIRMKAKKNRNYVNKLL